MFMFIYVIVIICVFLNIQYAYLCNIEYMFHIQVDYNHVFTLKLL